MVATTLFRFSLLALLLTIPAAAQQRLLPPFVLGIGGGYDVASGAFINGAGDDRGYDQSSSIRMASVSFIFPKLFMQGWGLTAALTYGDLDLSASGTGERTVYIGGAPTNGSTLHDYQLAMRMATFELMTHIHVGEHSRLELGPLAGIGFFPDWFEREEVLGPAGATFSSGATVRTDSGSGMNEGVFISGFGLRAGYEIPFFGDLALMPVVNIRGLVGFDGDGEGIVVAGTAGAGLSLLSGRTAGAPVGIVPVEPLGAEVPARDDSTASPPRLRAQLDLYSLDSAGRRSDTLVVSLRRTLRRIEVPLETFVRFEAASAALTARTITSAHDAAGFDEEGLVAIRPSEIRRRSLEVIGARLRAARALRIGVAGTRTSEEPAWFAEARGRSVRRYLQAVWGVDSSRVILAKGVLAAAGEAPGVRISSASPGALAPIVTEWFDQEVEAGAVGVQPTIVALQGVQSWRVSVMQGAREVGVVRNTDEEGARQIDIGMALRNLPRDEARHALGAELVVEDSAGGVAVARDRMEVVVEGAAPSTDARARMFVGEYVVAIADTAATTGTIERLVRALPVDARITVSAPVGHDADAARLERRLRALAATNGQVIGSIETASASHEEGLNGSLLLVSVRGAIAE
jgi:hypothetical protein